MMFRSPNLKRINLLEMQLNTWRNLIQPFNPNSLLDNPKQFRKMSVSIRSTCSWHCLKHGHFSAHNGCLLKKSKWSMMSIHSFQEISSNAAAKLPFISTYFLVSFAINATPAIREVKTVMVKATSWSETSVPPHQSTRCCNEKMVIWYRCGVRRIHTSCR
jgi:hypothetical protein